MLISKKGRLIWDESFVSARYTSEEIANRSIDPNISFDNGLSWMSLGDIASTLRATSGSLDSSASISASTSNAGFNQLDITFGFTPYAIPEITQISYTASDTGAFSGGQTYYFALMDISYDMPGFFDNEKDASGYYKYYTGNYYNGPVIGGLDGDVDKSGYYPISKLKSITLPSTSNKYNINLYVRYPDICKGLCIYYGTATGNTVTLNLCNVTNIVQRLGEDISANELDKIVLYNNFPLPSNGTVIIDGEKIQYSSCTWNNITSKWELRTLIRPNPAAHKADPSGTNDADLATRIYSAQFDGGVYGELPNKIYPQISVDANCVQLLNFDAKTLTDSATHVVNGEIKPNTTPTQIGTIGFDQVSIQLVNSLRLTSSGAVHCDIPSLSGVMLNGTSALDQLNTKGSIQFYMMLSNFKDAEISDPYIFCPISGQGLWMKISRFNLKPYIGYRYKYKDANIDTYYDIDIANFEDYRLPSLTKNIYSLYTLTWEVITQETATSSTDSSTLDNMRFKYIVDGVTIFTFDSSIHKTKFEIGDLVVGGAVAEIGGIQSVNGSFIGYIDDWRLYANKALTREETIEINKNNMQQNGIQHSARILLDANNTMNYNSTDIGGTSNNSLPGTLSKKYEPRLYTQIKVDSTAESVGKEYGTYYDSWFVKAYNTDGRFKDINNFKSGGGEETAYIPQNYTYPIKADSIKIKFDLVGPDNNLSSPKLKNIILMTSEATLD